jgi:hypothetical protein
MKEKHLFDTAEFKSLPWKKRIVVRLKVAFIEFISLMCLLGILTSCVSKPTSYTGSLTTGNPDNSYLDSCEVYCCGD